MTRESREQEYNRLKAVGGEEYARFISGPRLGFRFRNAQGETWEIRADSEEDAWNILEEEIRDIESFLLIDMYTSAGMVGSTGGGASIKRGYSFGQLLADAAKLQKRLERKPVVKKPWVWQPTAPASETS